jgi:RNA 3'-terminal phosphate cyclase (ATP)
MAALGRPILIDGSHGEGGGALVRTALVMSCVTLQPVRIDGVRTGTKYAGLDIEDLVLLRALAASCAAETTGAEVGSSSLSFLPTRHPRGLKGSLDLVSADRSVSAPVVLNALLPVLARTGMYSSVSLTGETYGHRTLSFDYFNSVTLAALRRLGLYAFADQELAGFGRESKGVMTMDVEPSALAAIDWSTRGALVGCYATVATGSLQPAVAERGIAHLQSLAKAAKLPMEVEGVGVDSTNPGAHVTVWAVCERGFGGSTAMGKRGVRMETLAHTAFEDVLDWLGTDATVDPNLADQLLVTACLAEGETTLKVNRLTERLITSIWVIKQFLPIHITVRGGVDEAGSVSIKR